MRLPDPLRAIDATDWNALSPDEADRMAYRAICEWHLAAGVEAVAHGMDFSKLARLLISHRVSRAIRRSRNPSGFDLEEKWIAEPLSRRDAPPSQPAARAGFVARGRRFLRRYGGQIFRTAAAAHRAVRVARSPLLFNPQHHARWQRTLRAIERSGCAYQVGRENLFDTAGLVGPPSEEFARGLAPQVLGGLAKFNITLLQKDADDLRRDFAMCHAVAAKAVGDLAKIQPDAVLMHSDNYSPFAQYAMAARHSGIPCILIPHGLDCERFVLDETYSSHVAVWGDSRRQRYLHGSSSQPTDMAITGYPEFDALRLPERWSTDGEGWLWVTRPHRPEKCHLPSQRPAEGLEILDALLAAVERDPRAKLTIKPHPYDYPDLYQQRIEASGLTDRVNISTRAVGDLIPAASLVFSEDSTVGMEAMFLGKCIIHIHFGACPPVMPFVEHEAALPGFGPEGLWESIERASHLSAAQIDRLLEGQRRCLLDLNGPCDGRAGERLTQFIKEVAAVARDGKPTMRL